MAIQNRSSATTDWCPSKKRKFDEYATPPKREYYKRPKESEEQTVRELIAAGSALANIMSSACQLTNDIHPIFRDANLCLRVRNKASLRCPSVRRQPRRHSKDSANAAAVPEGKDHPPYDLPACEPDDHSSTGIAVLEGPHRSRLPWQRLPRSLHSTSHQTSRHSSQRANLAGISQVRRKHTSALQGFRGRQRFDTMGLGVRKCRARKGDRSRLQGRGNLVLRPPRRQSDDRIRPRAIPSPVHQPPRSRIPAALRTRDEHDHLRNESRHVPNGQHHLPRVRTCIGAALRRLLQPASDERRAHDRNRLLVRGVPVRWDVM
jgi:hypothetical protein